MNLRKLKAFVGKYVREEFAAILAENPKLAKLVEPAA
jgi:hypothetical protein